MDTAVLVIASHCDDAELWTGGKIARSTAASVPVHVAVAHHTDIRRIEALHGGAEIGVEPRFRREGQPLLKWVEQEIHAARPGVLLAHCGNDPHPEHAAIFEGVIGALVRSRTRRHYPRRWYSFDHLARFQPGAPAIVDVSAWFDQKLRSLRMPVSQNVDELTRMAEAMAVLHGMKIRVPHGEAFHPFDLLGRWPVLREVP
jgi:LmbE family N-acetylglucosaminyl deacetylase